MRIAIIGASKNRNKYGNKALRAWIKAGAEAIPVNPHEEEIEGIKCYKSVKDIPGKLEEASFYVPPTIGLTVVNDCKEKGIKKAYLNPGSESEELIKALKEAGIEPIMACSIIAAGENPDKL